MLEHLQTEASVRWFGRSPTAAMAETSAIQRARAPSPAHVPVPASGALSWTPSRASRFLYSGSARDASRPAAQQHPAPFPRFWSSGPRSAADSARRRRAAPARATSPARDRARSDRSSQTARDLEAAIDAMRRPNNDGLVVPESTPSAARAVLHVEGTRMNVNVRRQSVSPAAPRARRPGLNAFDAEAFRRPLLAGTDRRMPDRRPPSFTTATPTAVQPLDDSGDANARCARTGSHEVAAFRNDRAAGASACVPGGDRVHFAQLCSARVVTSSGDFRWASPPEQVPPWPGGARFGQTRSLRRTGSQP